MNPLETAMAQQIDLQAEIESLRVELKFRTGQVEEKCLTIESLDQQVATKNREFQQAKEAIAHLEQGKPLGELVGKQTIINQQREISRLQSALDEERGKVMEWEWRNEHKMCDHDADKELLAGGQIMRVVCREPERHFWKREQWTKESRK